MDDIAHELKISKKTIYQYFNDKDQLVKKVASLIIEEKISDYKKVAECSSNAIEELVVIAKLIRKHFAEINPALMYDVRKYHPDAWALFAEHEKDVINATIVENIKRGQKEGFFRKELNPNIIAKIRFEQIHLTFNEQVFPNEEFDLTEVHVQLFDFFVHGILTPNGLEQYKKYENQTNE